MKVMKRIERFMQYFRLGAGGRCHNDRNGKEATEVTENPVGCAGEGKQSKGK